MVKRAAKEHSLDLVRSYLSGIAGRILNSDTSVGGKSILVRTGYGEGEFGMARRGLGGKARFCGGGSD